MATVRHHLGRTYILAAQGQGPFHGRFLLKGEGDGQLDSSAWHELDDDWPTADAAVDHADLVARQYIATFAQQA